MKQKSRALISVSNKAGIVDLARGLADLGYELVTTGGTHRLLKEAGIVSTKIESVTGMPEALDGRVKTLHPAIFSGILARRADPKHMEHLEKSDIAPIDVVITNLYPFKTKVKKGKTSVEDAVEWIDIGGVSLIRAAAKNHQSVLVVVDPKDYRRILKALRDDEVTHTFRHRLALKAFSYTSAYDALIQDYFSSLLPKKFAPTRVISILERKETLRYGENPHQRAALYKDVVRESVHYRILQGKQMSFNNYLDADAAVRVASFPFGRLAVCGIIKHLNPCGLAVAGDDVTAYNRALAADPVSAYGGIVATNVTIDEVVAREIAKSFYELIVAPGFSIQAQRVFEKKKNLRLLEIDLPALAELRANKICRTRHTFFGALTQEEDFVIERKDSCKVVGKTAFDEAYWADILIGLKFIRFFKSNSVILLRNGALIAAGIGQTSRVEAVSHATRKAQSNARGGVMVSDAFFPFPDSIDLASAFHVGVVVAPGGSIRDEEVIARADEMGVPLVFAPHRHFWH